MQALAIGHCLHCDSDLFMARSNQVPSWTGPAGLHPQLKEAGVPESGMLLSSERRAVHMWQAKNPSVFHRGCVLCKSFHGQMTENGARNYFCREWNKNSLIGLEGWLSS